MAVLYEWICVNTVACKFSDDFDVHNFPLVNNASINIFAVRLLGRPNRFSTGAVDVTLERTFQFGARLAHLYGFLPFSDHLAPFRPNADKYRFHSKYLPIPITLQCPPSFNVGFERYHLRQHQNRIFGGSLCCQHRSSSAYSRRRSRRFRFSRFWLMVISFCRPRLHTRGNTLESQPISAIRQRERPAALNLGPVIAAMLTGIRDGAMGGAAAQDAHFGQNITHHRNPP
jgi:hypothetical protein